MPLCQPWIPKLWDACPCSLLPAGGQLRAPQPTSHSSTGIKGFLGTSAAQIPREGFSVTPGNPGSLLPSVTLCRQHWEISIPAQLQRQGFLRSSSKQCQGEQPSRGVCCAGIIIPVVSDVPLNTAWCGDALIQVLDPGLLPPVLPDQDQINTDIPLLQSPPRRELQKALPSLCPCLEHYSLC